jgi:hypothetical protein
MAPGVSRQSRKGDQPSPADRYDIRTATMHITAPASNVSQDSQTVCWEGARAGSFAISGTGKKAR